MKKVFGFIGATLMIGGFVGVAICCLPVIGPLGTVASIVGFGECIGATTAGASVWGFTRPNQQADSVTQTA